MPARPVPTAPSTDREIALRTAEQEASALEAQLAAEAARLAEASGQLERKLGEVRARAAQLARSSAAAEAVGTRLDHAAVPGLELAEFRERALRAREAAVAARREAGEDGRRQVRACIEALSELNARLAEDERALLELERTAREDAAAATRKAAEAARQTERSSRTSEVPDAPEPSTTRTPAVATARAPTLPLGALESRQPRVRMQASIDLHSASNFFQGFSTNISEGGLFIATPRLAERGTPVDLQFTLPGGRQLAVKGRVCWTREVNDRTPDILPGVGVQFTDLSAEAGAAIREFVDQREPLFFPD